MSIPTTSLLSPLCVLVARGKYAIRCTTAIKSALALLLLAALSACSGGGSSGGESVPPAEPFTFAQAGPISLYAGQTFTNTAGGPGTDAVSYKSGDTSIAIVDASTGLVTVIAAGTVEIAAYKLVNIPNSSSQLVAGAATYTINSSAPLAFEQAGPLQQYVRDKFTNTVSGPGPGVPLYKSSDTTVATVDSATGEVTVVGPGSAVITAYKLAEVAISTSKLIASSATYTINALASGPEFSARYSHTVTAFNNQLWLIGGEDNTGLKNDVWSSTDGITWTLQTEHAAFSPRGLHQVVAFNNQLWLIGGFGGPDKDSQTLQSDVWSSSDGINWTEQTAAASFLPRAGHQVVVYNNQMVLSAGYHASVETNDVWSSSDGITWTQLTAAADFSTRHAHQMLVYNGQLWVIGGYDSGFTDTPLNDVWSSTDGVTWLSKTANADFPVRGNHQVVAYNNELWLVGGFDGSGQGTSYNDVWSSSDGVAWTEKTAAAPFWARNSHQLVVNNNQLLLLGGIATSPDGLIKFMFQSDAWTSTDGINWLVLYRGVFQAP